jgi:hypothetical protein
MKTPENPRKQLRRLGNRLTPQAISPRRLARRLRNPVIPRVFQPPTSQAITQECTQSPVTPSMGYGAGD